MILNLKCQRYSIGLRLPASQDDVTQARSELRYGVGKNAPISISEVFDAPCNLCKYIQSADLDSEDDVQKLNQLAKTVDGMDEREQHIFSGALDAESINGLDDVVRIASSLSQYEFIEGVTSDKELGGWLVEHGLAGVDFPDQVRPYLDYAGIGAAYYSDHGGAYTAQGYVKRREMAQTQAAEDKPAFALTLVSAAGSCQLSLPATDEDLEQARQKLGVGDLCSAVIRDAEIGYPWAHLLPMECVSVEDANVLAQCVRSMSGAELRTFGAVLEVEEPATFPEAVCAAMDLDDYELVDGTDGEYGREALRMAGAGDEIFDLLDGYTDFEQLGRALMEEDGVRETDFGAIKRLSAPFPPQPETGPTMY